MLVGRGLGEVERLVVLLGHRLGHAGRRPVVSPSFLPSSLSSASLALAVPVPMCLEYLPLVFWSAVAAALSMPWAILSPCWSTAFLALRLHLVEESHASDTSPVPDSPPESRSSPWSGRPPSGKTGLSLDLAERLGGEVVNTDAMQVYRGMDIGTAKLPVGRAARHHPPPARHPRRRPSRRQRRRVPGRGAGGDRRRCASAAWCRCWSAGRRSTPARSSTGSSSPAPTRRCGAGSRSELAEVGAAAMHARLAEVDPEAAGADPARQRPPDRPRAGGRRADRAAVHGVAAAAGVRRPASPCRSGSTSTGRPSTSGSPPASAGCTTTAWSRRSRGSARSDRPRPPRSATGRPPPTSPGELTLEEAIERTTTATRRFARRQESWFRKDPRITWVDHDDPDRVEPAVAAVTRLSARSVGRDGGRREQDGPMTDTSGRDRLRELLDAVLDDEHHSLADMAGGAFSSPYHFTRRLRRDAGEPPVAMRRRVMLERAAWQLRHGTLGHRRGVRRRLRVGRGVQPRLRPRVRPPAERGRGGAAAPGCPRPTASTSTRPRRCGSTPGSAP